MAIPTTLDSGMIADMMKAIADFKPLPNTLLVSPKWRAEMEKARYEAEPALIRPPPGPQPGLTFAGVPVYTIDIPPEEVLDWSECRSPSRAKRRHARGIKTRVKVTCREVGYLIDSRVLSDFTGRFERMAMKALFGGE